MRRADGNFVIGPDFFASDIHGNVLNLGPQLIQDEERFHYTHLLTKNKGLPG